MKNYTRFLSVCAAAAVLAMSALPAAAWMPTQTRAHIPFEFQVAGKTMPAGSYVFESLTPSGLMTLRSVRGDVTANVITNTVGSYASPANSGFVFQKKDGKYHLAEIWADGSSDGRALSVK